MCCLSRWLYVKANRLFGLFASITACNRQDGEQERAKTNPAQFGSHCGRGFEATDRNVGMVRGRQIGSVVRAMRNAL